MTRHSEIDAQLKELYTRVPPIPDCDGGCWISCGPLDMTPRERQRIASAGYRITPGEQARMRADTFWCEALTADKRCAVYELRPLICRLWGAVEDMRCPRGCVPEGGFLTAQEGWELIAEAERIAGARRPPPAGPGQLPAQAHAVMARIAAAGQGGTKLRAQSALPAGFRRAVQEFPCPACGFTLTIPPGGVTGGAVCGNCGSPLALPGAG